MRTDINNETLLFRVNGAGELSVGKNANGMCGGEYGVHISVSWGIYGFAGGVMPRAEAKLLMKHLKKMLKKKNIRNWNEP